MLFLDAIADVTPGNDPALTPLGGFEWPLTIALIALAVSVVILLIVRNKRK